jgi:hypothetical protein
MSEVVSWLVLLVGAANVVLLIVVLFRLPRKREDRDNALRVELRAGREEASRAARDSRDEISKNLRDANETLSNTLTSMGEVQRAQLDGVESRLARSVARWIRRPGQRT